MHVEKETPKREWVKPSFERQDLKDALAAISTNVSSVDTGTGYS